MARKKKKNKLGRKFGEVERGVIGGAIIGSRNLGVKFGKVVGAKKGATAHQQRVAQILKGRKIPVSTTATKALGFIGLGLLLSAGVSNIGKKPSQKKLKEIQKRQNKGLLLGIGVAVLTSAASFSILRKLTKVSKKVKTARKAKRAAQPKTLSGLKDVGPGTVRFIRVRGRVIPIRKRKK